MKEQYSRTRGGEYQTSTSIPGEQEAYESYDTLQNVGLCVSAISGFNELDVKNNVRADSLFTSRQRDEITSYPHRRFRFFFCHCDVLWEEARTGNQSQEVAPLHMNVKPFTLN